MNTGTTNIDLNSDSDVAIAYRKLKAVYPDITKEDLLEGKHTASGLAQDSSVVHLLGAKESISASSPEKFSASLDKYIDSKEKKGVQNKEGERMEYWPLVKVVKIFTKSLVLDSGLVLVDLVCLLFKS